MSREHCALTWVFLSNAICKQQHRELFVMYSHCIVMVIPMGSAVFYQRPKAGCLSPCMKSWLPLHAVHCCCDPHQIVHLTHTSMRQDVMLPGDS